MTGRNPCEDKTIASELQRVEKDCMGKGPGEIWGGWDGKASLCKLSLNFLKGGLGNYFGKQGHEGGYQEFRLQFL